MARHLVYTIILAAILSRANAQYDSLSYKFLDWYVTTLGEKKRFIDKWPLPVSEYHLGTQSDYHVDPETGESYRVCTVPPQYTGRIIGALISLGIDYDTSSLKQQVRSSCRHPFSQSGFKNAKVLSCGRLSPFDHTFRGRILVPFKHRRTIAVSMPLWTTGNKFTAVMVSVNDRMSRTKQSAIDIFIREPDGSFRLVKRLDGLN